MSDNEDNDSDEEREKLGIRGGTEFVEKVRLNTDEDDEDDDDE